MKPARHPLRILFAVARGDAFGGSSLHVMDMAKRLTIEGHIVRVLVGGTPDMEVPRRYTLSGIDFTCVPKLGREVHPLNDLRAAITMRREIRDFGPDLISLHSSKAGAIGRLAAIGLNFPLIYTPHCWSFVDGFPHAGFYRLVEKILAPFATRIVTVSEDERQLGLSKGVGKAERTRTIHNGVKDCFAGVDRDPGNTETTVSIVMVGRFEKQKDQGLLVEALNSLGDLSWKLTFLGDGPRKEECIQLVESLGMQDRIKFSGYSSSVDAALTQHDIFALITNWEGFPRSILEAMAASLPVVATDVGGNRESVLEGVTGLLVKRGDRDDLAEALRALITDKELRRQMGATGRDHYLRNFTFDTMFLNYLDYYRNLTESSQSNQPPAWFNREDSGETQHEPESTPSRTAARTANPAGAA